MSASIGVQNLIAFLRKNRWTQSPTPNDRFLIFLGPDDDNGKPIRLALPNSEAYADSLQLTHDALDLLAYIYNTSVKSISDSISVLCNDIFKIRTLIDRQSGSRPSLNSAADSINNIRRQIIASACVEMAPKPFYSKASSAAVNQADICSFGHTFDGSFGFTVESPIPYSQMDFGFIEKNEPPFNRRVLERLIRGINYANIAAEQDDLDIITNNYESGLNANMCSMLMKLIESAHSNLEYSIAWSSAIDPSEDIKDLRSVNLTARTYLYLKEADTVLRKTEWSETRTITGTISNIGVDNQEHAEYQEHVVKILCMDDEFKGKRITIYLDNDQFRLACDALKNTMNVRATGVLQRINGRYYIYETEAFAMVLST